MAHIGVKTKPQRSRNKFLREERDTKRAAAKTRQAAYDLYTPEQKLALLDAEGFVAKKQRAKLNAAIAARKAG